MGCVQQDELQKRAAALRRKERENRPTSIEEDTTMERVDPAFTPATRPDPHNGITVEMNPSRPDRNGLRSSMRNKHTDTNRHGLVVEHHENRAFQKDDDR